MKRKPISITILILLVAFIGYRFYDNRRAIESIDQIDKLAKEAALKAVDSLKMRWSIRETKDEMTDRNTKIASAISQNTVNFDFPYEGGSTLSMYIREKDSKIDVYFIISQGQFVCNEYSGTDEIVMRFDEDEAITYKTSESATGDSKYLFIRYDKDAKQILNKCRTSKMIRVKAPFYQEGSRVFTFNVNEPLSF